jgi:hypothetical protein
MTDHIHDSSATLCIEPGNNVDRGAIVKWLKKQGHSFEYTDDGKIATALPYTSLKANVAIGMIKDFTQACGFHTLTKHAGKVEGGKPTPGDVHSTTKADLGKDPKLGGVPGTTELKLSKLTPSVSVDKSGGGAKGEAPHSSEKPGGSLKNIWDKARSPGVKLSKIGLPENWREVAGMPALTETDGK